VAVIYILQWVGATLFKTASSQPTFEREDSLAKPRAYGSVKHGEAIPVCSHVVRNKIKLAGPTHCTSDSKSQRLSCSHLLTNLPCTWFFLRHAIAPKGDKHWTFAARLRAHKNRLSQVSPQAVAPSLHPDRPVTRVWSATRSEHVPSNPWSHPRHLGSFDTWLRQGHWRCLDQKQVCATHGKVWLVWRETRGTLRYDLLINCN